MRSVVTSLSAYLRTYVSLSLVNIEQLSYGSFLESMPSTACLACLALQPYDGNAILAIDPALCFPILEILLGGTGKTATAFDREVTEIEQTLMEGFFRIITNDLTEAWKSVTTINFEILSVGTESQLLHAATPVEAVLAVRFEMRLGEITGSMNIVMPSMVINMMRQKFEHQRSTRKVEVSEEEQRRTLELIQGSTVQAEARLLGEQSRTRDLLRLQVGDVLALDVAVNDPVDFVLNGQSEFKGMVVSIGNKRGVYISGAIAG